MRFGAALLLILAGCVGGVHSSRRLKPELVAPPEDWQGVGRIAVMPPDNWTNDIGLEYIAWYRAVMADSLRRRKYEVTPLVEVNRFLLKNHFTMAGELNMFEVRELADAFHADALLYWNITGPGPKLQFFLIKADGTDLWATGEVVLGLAYNAVPTRIYDGNDSGFAMVLDDVISKLPVRR